MSSDSSTGGYLLPAAPPAPAPLEGLQLLRFLQQWVVGVTGLDGTLVRPRWQPEPPNVPQAGDAWAAVGVSTRPNDEYPYNDFNQVADAYVLQRHEELDVLTSFYDLGSTGLADYYCALFRDGTAIPQNREPLVLAGMNLARIGAPTAVPVVMKQRWQYRVDLALSIRREIDRQYPVDVLVGTSGTIYTDVGYPPQSYVVPRS